MSEAKEPMLVQMEGRQTRDPFTPTSAPRSRVRVTVESQKTILGHALPPGTSDIIIPTSYIESDGPMGKSLRSRTRTPFDVELWERAIAMDAAEYADYLSKNRGGSRLKFDGNVPRMHDSLQKVRGPARGMPPIVSFEVIEGGLPPEKTAETEGNVHMQKLADAILRGMPGGAKGGDSAEVLDLRARLAESEARNAKAEAHAKAMDERLAVVESRLAGKRPG